MPREHESEANEQERNQATDLLQMIESGLTRLDVARDVCVELSLRSLVNERLLLVDVLDQQGLQCHKPSSREGDAARERFKLIDDGRQ